MGVDVFSDERDDGSEVELEVTLIRGEGWRVRLADGPRDNPFSLLGFVFKRDDGYELSRIGWPKLRESYPELRDAIEALRPTRAEVPSILSGRAADEATARITQQRAVRSVA
jgi:hypothetical protein